MRPESFWIRFVRFQSNVRQVLRAASWLIVAYAMFQDGKTCISYRTNRLLVYRSTHVPLVVYISRPNTNTLTIFPLVIAKLVFVQHLHSSNSTTLHPAASRSRTSNTVLSLYGVHPSLSPICNISLTRLLVLSVPKDRHHQRPQPQHSIVPWHVFRESRRQVSVSMKVG